MIDEKNKFISQLSVLRHDAAENRPLVHCITHGITMNDTEHGVLKDYQKQKAAGKNPVFKAASIGLRDEDVEYWK